MVKRKNFMESLNRTGTLDDVLTRDSYQTNFHKLQIDKNLDLFKLILD